MMWSKAQVAKAQGGYRNKSSTQAPNQDQSNTTKSQTCHTQQFNHKLTSSSASPPLNIFSSFKPSFLYNFPHVLLYSINHSSASVLLYFPLLY
jgi:hypothetical protein